MGIPAPQGVAASGLPPTGDQANAVLSGIISAVGPTAPFAFRGPMNVFLWASIKTALTTTANSLSASVASGTGIAAGQAVNSVNVPRGTTWATFSGTSGTLALPPLSLPGVVNTTDATLKMAVPVGYTLAQLVGATVTGPGIPSGTTVLSVVQAGRAPSLYDQIGQHGVLLLSATPTSASSNILPAYPQGATPRATPTGQNPLQIQQFSFALGASAIIAGSADANATFTGAGITWSGTAQLERSFDGGATWIVANIGASGTLAQWTGTTLGPVSFTFGEPEKNVLYRLNTTVLTSVQGSGSLNYRISQTGGAAESLAIGPLTGG